MFLRSNSLELDIHTIHLEWRYLSDYTPLTVNISIDQKYIPIKKHVIIKNSEDKDNFIAELIDFIKRLDTKSLMNKNGLNRKVQEFANIADHIWFRHSKLINITKHSKTW